MDGWMDVKEGLTPIIRSGSEDYLHPEKLYLCGNLWALPLGEINSALCFLMLWADAKRHNRLQKRSTHGPPHFTRVVVRKGWEYCMWSTHESPHCNSLQPRMMSLLALQRSNQSPTCLKGPLRYYQALIVVSNAPHLICITALRLVCVYMQHTSLMGFFYHWEWRKSSMSLRSYVLVTEH